MGGRCGGIKAKLNKLAFALNLLQRIEVAEQANKTTLITLELPELPEEIKTLIQEKMKRTGSDHQHGHCCFAKELCSLEKGNFSSAMTVNKDYQIEKITITFDGVQNQESQSHVLNIVGELQLIY
jgi:hypothetical protein